MSFLPHLAFEGWHCCFCVLTWPVPSHQASVMETVSTARSHLSLTHKSSLLTCALTHTPTRSQITSGSPTTPFTLTHPHTDTRAQTHTCCPNGPVNHSFWKSDARICHGQTVCTVYTSDGLINGHTHTHLLYKHRVKVIYHVWTCLSNPKILYQGARPGHFLLSIWWLSCVSCLIEAVSALMWVIKVLFISWHVW